MKVDNFHRVNNDLSPIFSRNRIRFHLTRCFYIKITEDRRVLHGIKWVRFFESKCYSKRETKSDFPYPDDSVQCGNDEHTLLKPAKGSLDQKESGVKDILLLRNELNVLNMHLNSAISAATL